MPMNPSTLKLVNLGIFRESSFNMTRVNEDIETPSLKFQQPPLPPPLAVQFFRSPLLLLLVLKYTIFGAPPTPPPSPTIFSEPPFQVSKKFRSTPSISSPPPPPPPPCHIKSTFPYETGKISSSVNLVQDFITLQQIAKFYSAFAQK